MQAGTFDVAFDFAERVPLLTAEVNRHRLDRFLLDTGAPSSCLHKDVVQTLGLAPDGKNAVHVDSLRCGDLDFGPLELKVGTFGQNRVHGVLGTREIKSYCVTLDLDRCVCIFEVGPDHGSGPFSRLELFRGRPTVLVEYRGQTLRFVLDTGSSVNWLFLRGQDRLPGMGTVVELTETAKAAKGNLAVNRATVFENMTIGGRVHADVQFLLSEANQFGGYDAPEDGILGLSAIAASGLAVVDFRGEKFLLTGGT